MKGKLMVMVGLFISSVSCDGEEHAGGLLLGLLSGEPAEVTALARIDSGVYYDSYDGSSWSLLRTGMDRASTKNMGPSGQDWMYFDLVNDYVYFTGFTPKTYLTTIERSRIDGSDRQIVRVIGTSVYDITVDHSNQKLYWIQYGTVRRANLDGSYAETVYSFTGSVKRIAVDPARNRILFVRSTGAAQQIWQVSLDGSSAAQLCTESDGRPSTVGFIDYDLESEILYYTDRSRGTVSRVNVTPGCAISVIATGQNVVGGISLDRVNDKLYWVSESGLFEQYIIMANPDGSDAEFFKEGLHSVSAQYLMVVNR